MSEYESTKHKVREKMIYAGHGRLDTATDPDKANELLHDFEKEVRADALEKAADEMWAAMPGTLTQFSSPEDYEPYRWLKRRAQQLRQK